MHPVTVPFNNTFALTLQMPWLASRQWHLDHTVSAISLAKVNRGSTYLVLK